MDLKLSSGKMAAQACHACLNSYLKTGLAVRKAWELEGAKKIVLGCESLDELRSLEVKARSLRLPHSMITDAGHTEVPAGTITALGVGPGKDAEIDKITGSLKLLK